MGLFNFDKQLRKISRSNTNFLKKKSRSHSNILKKINKRNADTIKNNSEKNARLLKKFLDVKILGDIRTEKRKPLSAKLKREVYEKYKRKCNHGSCVKRQPLDIHHINFKNNVNKLSNLRLLCPNHHRLIHEKKFKKVYSREWNKKHK